MERWESAEPAKLKTFVLADDRRIAYDTRIDVRTLWDGGEISNWMKYVEQ